MNWLTDRPIAHRGFHSGNSDFPENSLKAFSEAVKNDYIIELDVQLTADQKLVVFHDADLLRMCHSTKKIESTTLAELQSFNLLDSEEKIPSFQEVLANVNGKVPILIELKSESPKVGVLEATLAESLKAYERNIAVQSFNPFSIGWFKTNAPSITRGQLSSNFNDVHLSPVKKYLLKYMLLNYVGKPQFIAYNKQDIFKNYLQKYRKSGKPLLGWTVTSKKESAALLPYCDNIIFEGFLP